jgi:hypothetical protein
MKTGTDCNLQECRACGYPVVEHGRRPLDPAKPYNLTISNPRHWPDGRLRVGTRSRDAWKVDTFTSYKDLWETFERAGQGIRDFCDFENCPLPAPDESPTFHDFVHLAGIVDSYCGID